MRIRRRLLIAAIAVATVVTLSFGAYAFRTGYGALRDMVQAQRDDGRLRASLREMLTIRAGILPDDTPEIIARKLTNHLHAHIDQSLKYHHTDLNPLRYFLTVDGLTSNTCDMLSGTLIWMLDLFDIQSREIHFAAEDFLNGTSIYATHTMIEADIGAKVVAVDPTFNAVYRCAGNDALLDGKEMIECNRSGHVVPEYLGPQVLFWKDNNPPMTEIFNALDAAEKPSLFYSYETPEHDWIRETRKAHYN